MTVTDRERRFQQLLWPTAVLPVVLSVAASLLLAHLIGKLLDRAHWVDHTDQVIAQAREVKEIGLSLENALLALQLTNQASVGESYARGSEKIEAAFDRLSHLVSDNPPQVQRADDLRAAFRRWGAQASRRLQGLAEAGGSLPGENEFKQFSQGLDAFVHVEDNLRLHRTQALESQDYSLRLWRTVIWVSAGVALSLVLWRQLQAIAGLFRASEAAVRERAEVLQTTLASIGDAVLATDEKGRITFLNPVAEQLTGWSSAEAQGRPLGQVFALLDETTRAPVPDPTEQVLRQGHTITLSAQTVLRSRRQRELAITARAAPIRQSADGVLGLVVVFRDITEEHRTQQTQSRLAAIVRYSEDAIIGKDLEGVITAWNEGARRMFGYQEEEALGQPMTLLFPPELRQEEPAILEAVRRAQPVEHYETVRLTKDGRRVEVSSSVSPIFDEQGRVTGASSILRDITRFKADQAELRRARDELEQRVAERTLALTHANQRLQQLDRFRSEFLAAMSHELRTPLNSIIGFTEILKERRAGPVSDKQAQYLGMALGSARHLLNLINDLLDISRIEAGKEEVFLETFDLQEVVQSAVQTVQTAADTKHLRLEAEVMVGEPVYSDRKKVYQIILNLLGNAVKFTDRGTVRLEARTQDGQLEVSVSDTGIGMTPEQLTSLFEQFRRLEKPARRLYEGTGLGLYLCKKLVTLLGGDIWAESHREKGSRFTFRIPVRLQELAHV